MPEHNQGNNDSAKANKNNNRASYAWLWWVATVGGVGFLALLLTSIYLPNLTDRIKFFTTNVLSLFVLAVIVIQAVIYRKQWEVLKEQSDTLKAHSTAMAIQIAAMEGQLTVMQDQADSMKAALTETRNIVAQNERAVVAAEQSATVAREAFYIGEAPYFGTSKIVFRWATRSVDGLPYETGQPELVITFLNGGKTPAWHFSAVPHLVLGESPVEGKWLTLNVVLDRECPDAENTFYPSGDRKCIKYQGRNEFSSAELEAINAQKQTLFLIVDIGYSDMRDSRETRSFIRCFNPKTRGFGDCGGRQS